MGDHCGQLVQGLVVLLIDLLDGGDKPAQDLSFQLHWMDAQLGQPLAPLGGMDGLRRHGRQRERRRFDPGKMVGDRDAVDWLGRV